MSKTIWILNHYATNMFYDHAGRHYSFAENLLQNGYSVKIFCASTNHFSKKYIEIKKKEYSIKITDGISFVFIKTNKYDGNGFKRILNIMSFYFGLIKVTKKLIKQYGKPDIILASSAHLLTLVAGIKISKKYQLPCICEIRDLWPESIIEYNLLKKEGLIAKILYKIENWVYAKADKLIFTMEGGKNYICDKKWDNEHGGSVNINKVYHINNGVDLHKFEFNKINYILEDEDINEEQMFKVIYTGSIRQVNNLKKIVEVAEYLIKIGETKINILIYGDGIERKTLEDYCKINNLSNIKFKGQVDKKFIPYILTRSNLNIIHFQQNEVKKYGQSLNKLFEYLASGKPILSDCEFGYDLIKKYDCGVVIDNANAKELAEVIISFSKMPESKLQYYCNNALLASKTFDYKKLSIELDRLILNTLGALR